MQGKAGTLRGDAALDADGVLNGWCWDPARPDERLAVEILSSDAVIATVRAAQLRDDLQAMKYGDGRHGFAVTLSRQVAQAGQGLVLLAREQASGQVFWRKIFGDVAVPPEFARRLAEVRAGLGAMAQDAALMPRCPGQAVRTAFAALGQELQARAGTQAVPMLPLVAAPRLSLLALVADVTRLALLAPGLVAAQAELVLAGPVLPCANLTSVTVPGLEGAAALNVAARAARAPMLGVFDPDVPDFIAPDLQGAVLAVPGFLAVDAARVAPGLAERIEVAPVPRLPGLGLAVARGAFDALHGFDAGMDDGAGLAILDLVLRACAAGHRVAAWHAPWMPEAARPAPENAEAGRRFVQRWRPGLV